jgi:hypothetical protein
MITQTFEEIPPAPMAPGPAPVPPRPAVAPALAPLTAQVAIVAPLNTEAAHANDQSLGAAISEVLAVALADRKKMTVLERRRLHDVLQEQKLTAAGLVDPATAARVGKLLSAQIVVSGTMVQTQPKLRGTILVIAVDRGLVLGSIDLDIPRDRLVTGLLDVSRRVADLAGVQLPAVQAKDLDDSPVGRLHLMRGIGYYHAGNPDLAIAACLRAVQLDPRLQEARVWIARSYLRQGEKRRARLELEIVARNPGAGPAVEQAEQLLKEIR